METFQLIKGIKEELNKIKRTQEIQGRQQEQIISLLEKMQMKSEVETQSSNQQLGNFTKCKASYAKQLAPEIELAKPSLLQILIAEDIKGMLHKQGLRKKVVPLADESMKLTMTIIFLDRNLGHVNVNKRKNNNFFLEVDMQEVTESGEVSFSQRGYIAEIDVPEPEKGIRVFIPLVDQQDKQIFEECLDTENEINFYENLVKIQTKVPLFASNKKELERIHIEINDENQKQEEVQIDTCVRREEPEVEQRADESMADNDTVLISIGEAFYIYNRHQFTTTDIKEVGERKTSEGLSTTVGTFTDESSFIGIQIAGSVLILKCAIPSSSIEQQQIHQLMTDFALKMSTYQSEELLMDEINKKLAEHRGNLELFGSSEVNQGETQIQLFKIQQIQEGEQLMRLLSR